MHNNRHRRRQGFALCVAAATLFTASILAVYILSQPQQNTDKAEARIERAFAQCVTDYKIIHKTKLFSEQPYNQCHNIMIGRKAL